jgi:DNA replication protein DnaC
MTQDVSPDLFLYREDVIKDAYSAILKKFGNEYDKNVADWIFMKFMIYLKSGVPLMYIYSIHEDDYMDKKCKEYDPNTSDLSQMKDIWEDYLERYVDKFDKVLNKGYSFFFIGYNESGKTYSALKTLMHLIESGYTGYYINMRDLMLLYNKVNFSGEASDVERSVLDHIYKCQFLVVDEVGKENVTSNVLGALETLIKSRQGANLPTTFISNLVLNSKKNEVKETYKDSIWSCLTLNYKFIIFSIEGKFRSKARGEWDL